MASTVADPHERELHDALAALDGTAFPFSVRTVHDAQVRDSYRKAIGEASDEIRAEVAQGRLTPTEGAARAVAMRNQVLELSRRNSSEFYRAIAERLKKVGKTLDELVESYAQRLYTRPATALTAAERDAVMHEIIAAAGRDNARVSGMLRFLGPASRGLIALSIGLAIYDIYQAPDRPKEALHQGVVAGSGMVGSYLLGAAGASLVCGPGAPVCVGVFVLVGGVGFALGADYFWHRGQAGDGHR